MSETTTQQRAIVKLLADNAERLLSRDRRRSWAALRAVVNEALTILAVEWWPGLSSPSTVREKLSYWLPLATIAAVRSEIGELIGSLIPAVDGRGLLESLEMLESQIEGHPFKDSSDRHQGEEIIPCLRTFVLPMEFAFRVRAMHFWAEVVREHAEIANQDAIAEQRESRLVAFMAKEGISLGEFADSANMDRRELLDWRNGDTGDESIMTGRIEQVFSGELPIVRKKKRGRPMVM